jgi:peptidyl-prolyl cis-trans isomerase A (cyclophilin A)
MYQRIAIFLVLLLAPIILIADPDCFPDEVLPDNRFPAVEFQTSMGNIVVELNRNRAPATVNNFLGYVLDGHYDNTIFHRVIADFVVQGGGYTTDIDERPVREPVLNESGNGLENNAGTIAMARFNDPHTATDQFFFNLKNNDNLNPGSRNWGYTVFGDIISGQDVLQAIGKVETGFSEALNAQDVPVEPVILISAKVQE